MHTTSNETQHNDCPLARIGLAPVRAAGASGQCMSCQARRKVAKEAATASLLEVSEVCHLRAGRPVCTRPLCLPPASLHHGTCSNTDTGHEDDPKTVGDE